MLLYIFVLRRINCLTRAEIFYYLCVNPLLVGGLQGLKNVGNQIPD